MDVETMMNNIDIATKGELEESKKRLAMMPEQVENPQPIDLYQNTTIDIREDSQKSYPKGSSAAVNMSTTAVIDGIGAEGLAKAYKRAQDDVDALKDQGDRKRAEIRRKQYMQEDFLPAVEIVVNSTSPDEVLNSKKALQELDKYVLLEGSGKGYTASYIRQAYGNQLGHKEGHSDDSVRSGVININALLDEGRVHEALGIANNLMDKIKRGDAMADDIDYALLGRVTSFYS